MDNISVMQKRHAGMKDFGFKPVAKNILTALIGIITLLFWIKALHDICPLGIR